MSIAARILLVPISLVLMGMPSQETAPSAEPASFDAYTAEQEALITFAIGRFEQAGLSLPAVTIVFPDEPTEC